MKFGRDSLLKCLDDAPEVKVEGIFTVSDFEQSLDAIFEHGLQKGVTNRARQFRPVMFI